MARGTSNARPPRRRFLIRGANALLFALAGAAIALALAYLLQPARIDHAAREGAALALTADDLRAARELAGAGGLPEGVGWLEAGRAPRSLLDCPGGLRSMLGRITGTGAAEAKPAPSSDDVDRSGASLAFGSFQFRYDPRGERSILLNVPPDAAFFAELAPRGSFHDEAWERIQSETLRAEAIVATSETASALGGVARSPYLYDIRDKLRLSLAQLRSPRIYEARMPPSVVEAMGGQACQGMCRLAPGLVFLPAPGHSPGSGLLYARIAPPNADDEPREYVFIGETASRLECIRLRRGRPRLGDWLDGRDGARIARELEALARLAESEAVILVPVYDLARIETLIKKGLLDEGFRRDDSVVL